jgi:hypothetical protein
MPETSPSSSRGTVRDASRRLVAFVLLLCVGTSSVEVILGNEPAPTAATWACSTLGSPSVPVPAGHGDHDEGCPCFCACGCAGAVLTVAPAPPAPLSPESVQRVAETDTVLRPTHRTTPPRVRPPLA